MEHRLIIAIDIPEAVRVELRKIIKGDVEANNELYANARMMDEESWHITLAFLGEKSKEHIATIEQVLQEVTKATPAPEIVIRTVTTAPPQRPPRMVWATTTTETNLALGPIKDAVIKGLAAHDIRQEGEVFPNYHGHITLARLPEGRRIANHIISLPNALAFQPRTIDLMESHLESSGAKYKTLKSIDFKPSV